MVNGVIHAADTIARAHDARGNDTVTVAAIDPATQSSYETTMAPGILNFATNWYTDGVMVSNISHSGVLTQIRRDALRREMSRIDGRGNVSRTEYDALGRVAATVDALTNATTYAYDPMGRVAAVTNALGHATVYEYDARGNRTYEGGATYPVRYTYDVYGNKTTMTTYRHYEPLWGRWLNRDSIDESGGVCLYAFVFNASVMANDALGQFDAKDVLSSGLCFVSCYFGFTVDEIRDLYYAWTAPEKLPRHVRRTFELEVRKHMTGSKSVAAVPSSEMQKAIKELGYKKLRNKLSEKAGGKALKALAPNAVPAIGQVVSVLMTASEVWTACKCAWACAISKFF